MIPKTNHVLNVHVAAHTMVDKTEEEPGLAVSVNGITSSIPEHDDSYTASPRKTRR